MNNLGMNKINLSGLNQINTNQNGNNVPNNKSNNPENENQEEIDIKALNEDYSLKDSERKKIISDYYSKHLSEVIPNFLYLSSYNATKNKSLLEKNKITHIINCAADFCENVFESENKYTYLSFYLKDHVLENIECIFYECIKFIDNVKEKGGRVLVHCIQGISRSVTLVMAYLIYKNKLTYDKAFNIVQSKREISSPNFGFSIQLQNFYLRLYEPASKFRYIPKIFAVGSFQNEQPEKIVCRLMNEPFFEHKENGIPRMFDKRGIFIIVSLNKVYLWLGSKISSTNKDIYLKTALDYINILKEYEHAPVDESGPIYMYDEKENEEFINELLTTKEKKEMFKNKISDIFPEWNSWYKEIKIGGGKNNLKDKNNGGNLNDNNFDSKYNNGNNIEIKKGFFVYPNDKPDTVLDLDDLTDETYLVACVYQNNKPKIFLWKGKFVDINEKSLTEYKNKVKKYFFEEYNFSEEELNKIECVNEIPLEESDEFLSFIQICY
jgi:protein-tyrosine phosphatase